MSNLKGTCSQPTDGSNRCKTVKFMRLGRDSRAENFDCTEMVAMGYRMFEEVTKRYPALTHYDDGFSIGLSTQENTDLVEFLRSLPPANI
jgi:hypothetical protein